MRRIKTIASRGGEARTRQRVARRWLRVATVFVVAIAVGGCSDDAGAARGDARSVAILTAGSTPDSAMSALGTFTLHYDSALNCLYHNEPDNNGEPGTGGRVAVVWPAGYTASVHDDGQVTLFDADGRAVAQTNTAFQIAGGATAGAPGYCDAIGTWIAAGSPHLTVTPTPPASPTLRPQEPTKPQLVVPKHAVGDGGVADLASGVASITLVEDTVCVFVNDEATQRTLLLAWPPTTTVIDFDGHTLVVQRPGGRAFAVEGGETLSIGGGAIGGIDVTGADPCAGADRIFIISSDAL